MRRTWDAIAVGDWAHFGVYLAIIAAIDVVSSAGDFSTLLVRFNFLLLALIGVVVASISLRRWASKSTRATLADSLFFLAIVFGVIASGIGIYRSAQAAEPATSGDIQVLTKASLALPNAKIDGQAFPNAKLESSDFRGAQLTDVNLSGADLIESDFRGASLENVNLSGADLCGVDARGTDFTKAIGLAEVARWDFLIYDSTTKFPADVKIESVRGPIETKRSTVLISCAPGQTKLLTLKGGS